MFWDSGTLRRNQSVSVRFAASAKEAGSAFITGPDAIHLPFVRDALCAIHL